MGGCGWWLLGGQVQFSSPESREWEEAQYPGAFHQFRTLDLAYWRN